MAAVQQKNRISSKSLSVAINKPSIIDLCCGLGGLSLAATQSGMEVVAGVDLDGNALKTFKNNFSQSKSIEGDISSKKTLDALGQLSVGKELIVVSGPPCQGFSMAGPRDPKDPRNQILLAAAKAIVRLQPRCALIENVSMVLAPVHDVRLRKLKKILEDGNYHIVKILLNASEFGVPQKRRRAFFFITRNELSVEAVMKGLEVFRAESGGALDAFRGLPKPKIRPDKYIDHDELGSVFNHFAMQHSKKVMRKISLIAPGTGPMSYRRLHPTRPSNTLFSGHRAPPAHFREPRSITVREAARLQGIPDEFRIYGSFGSQMGQVTNAVPIALGKAALSVLLDLSE